MLRRLYDWVLSWSERRGGWLALFFIALFEASWFPLPPDVLLIALCVGAPKKSFRFASICLLGSVLGAALGYGIGSYLWFTPTGDFTGVAQFFFDSHIFTTASYQHVCDLYDKWNFWIVYTAGFTPLPFKLCTITAGACEINFPMFIIASLVGRGMRFFLIGGLIWKFGAPIKALIDKYFNTLATLFTILLIGITALVLGVLGNDEEKSTKSVAPATTEETLERDTTTSDTDSLTTIEPCDTLDL